MNGKFDRIEWDKLNAASIKKRREAVYISLEEQIEES